MQSPPIPEPPTYPPMPLEIPLDIPHPSAPMPGVNSYIGLYNVLPLNVGIRLSSGEMDPLLVSGTRIPCESKSKAYKFDPTRPLTLTVFQGNNPRANDNQEIGMTAFRMEVSKMKDSRFYLCLSVDENNLVQALYKYHKKDEWMPCPPLEARGGLVLDDDMVEQLRIKQKRLEESNKLYTDWIFLLNEVKDIIGKTSSYSSHPSFNPELRSTWSNDIMRMDKDKGKEVFVVTVEMLEEIRSLYEQINQYMSLFTTQD